MTIRFAPQAEADFAAVIGYLAERSPSAAQALGERIFELVDKLAAGDFEGPEQTLISGARPQLAGAARARLLPAAAQCILDPPHLSPSSTTDYEMIRTQTALASTQPA